MTDTLTETEMTRVQDILIEQLHIQREQITPEARIMEDLGADSLDMVEIAMNLEEKLGLSGDDEEMEGVQTVGDLFEAVDRRLLAARQPK